jgi:hypothetical protein
MTRANGFASIPTGALSPVAVLPCPLLVFAFFARLTLSGLFLWAGALKLSHPRAFAHVVDEYGLVPAGWPLVVAAFAIPTLEVLAGLGVILDRRGCYRLMLGMLALSIGVLWFGILNDLDVECGCFSLEEQRGQASLKAAYFRDWVMAAGVVWCTFVKHRGTRSAPATETTNREEKT